MTCTSTEGGVASMDTVDMVDADVGLSWWVDTLGVLGKIASSLSLAYMTIWV